MKHQRQHRTLSRLTPAARLAAASLVLVATATADDEQLFAFDGAANDHFGSVAAGDARVAVGAPDDDDMGSDSGSVYILALGAGGWVHEDKVTASDGGADDHFGGAVALSEDLLLVSSTGDDDRGTDAGAAYVFRRQGQAWVQEAKLLASDGVGGDRFGSSVAITADYAVVGAYNHGGLGAAYVFRRNGTQWTQERQLTSDFGLFGFDVAADGEWISVGGAEGVAIFRESAGSWPITALLPPVGGAGALFGISVDIEADRLVVGAWLDDQVATNAGAAYVFARTGTQWGLEQTLYPSDGNANQFFGGHVALSGSRALVGSHADDDNGPNTGSVYVYERVDTTWSEVEKIVPAGTVAWDSFGGDVALEGPLAIMGAAGDDGVATDAGTAFVRCYAGTDPGGTFEPGSFTEAFASACDTEVCVDPAAVLSDVHGFNGEFHQRVEDMRIPGRGFDFVLGRTYRSRLGEPTAMGNNWVFSYDVSLQPSGSALVLRDGSGRRDTYELEPGGSWARDEFFRTLTQVTGGGFVLTFPDTSVWRFHPLTHATAPGRLFEIEDRNHNVMALAYDAQGRLETVRDTLHTTANPREITFDYDAQDRLVAVADWVGRQVTYTYYPSGSPNGSAGDLASVTSPAVVPSADFPLPSGAAHQFPSGKTTVYTYTTGFSEPELNGNLLTITDPSGQVRIQNSYATTQDPANFLFDHLVRQELGTTGTAMNLAYVPMTPTPANLESVVQVIVNDRNGHVSALQFDERNRAVLLQQFTGRWSADSTVTPPMVPPFVKLRPGDPDLYETRIAYNEDSLPTRIVHPSGAVTEYIHELELNPAAGRRSRGNLREVRKLPGTHTPVGDQPMLVELFTYGSSIGGCCGTNFVQNHTDPRGNVTTHEYDARGNRTRTIHRLSSIVEDFTYNAWGQLESHTRPADVNGNRRVDTFEYYLPSDGYQYGYLSHEVVDDAGTGITTVYTVDRVGNRVRTIDPQGDATDTTYNQLGQVVRVQMPAYAPGGLRPIVDIFYDANDNVSRTETCNLGENGQPLANPWITDTFEYDVLDNVIVRSDEIVEGSSARVEFEYDAQGNMMLERSGVATNGAQPANEVRYQHDERNLLFRTTRGPGSPGASTEQVDYDGNGSVVRRIAGVGAQPREWVIVRDAYDRMVTATDPMGNVTQVHYDENGNPGGDANGGMQNPFGVRLLGQEDDVVGSAGNVVLGQVWYAWDEMDRRIYEDQLHVDIATQTAIGDGSRTLRYAYAPDGAMTSRTDDDGGVSTMDYDTAGRLVRQMDPAGNEIRFTWDNEVNMLSRVAVDRSTSGGPARTYRTTYAYDALSRRVRMVDGEGNETIYGHDSRGNRTFIRDPRGNVTRQVFDGRSLLLETRGEMRAGGNGGGAQEGAIVTRQVFDEAGRMTAQIDPNGNVTTYSFDALDRQVRTTFADGSFETTVFNVFDDMVETRDANGTRVTSLFDRLGRPTTRNINRASLAGGAAVDVLGSTQETFHYNGRSWTVSAVDNYTESTREHDSLGNVTGESLRIGNGPQATTGVTTTSWDGDGNRTSLGYPGGRRIEFDHDLADRLRTVRDVTGGGNGVLASYDFLGDSVERRGLGNGVQSYFDWSGADETTNAPNDRGFRQIARIQDERGASLFQRRQFAWDRSGNRASARIRRGSSTQVTTYDHDSASRLVSSRSHRIGGTAQGMPDRGPTTILGYELDDAGNRTSMVANGPTRWSGVGDYTMNGQAGGPADAPMNRYTTSPLGQHSYDANGNLIGIAGRFSASYDYRDRLVQFRDLATGELHTYRFDAFGRRVERTLDVSGTPSVTRYFYEGDLCIEEQGAAGQTLATFVHGAFFDELVETTRGAIRYFVLVDDLLSVTALTSTSGQIVEQYVYGDFGETLYQGTNGAPQASSSTGNTVLFAGRRLDPETGWYHLRTRMMDPGLGRFTSSDSIGIWGDTENAGNGYTYAANRPTVLVDPFGTLGRACKSFKEYVKGIGDDLPWDNWKTRRLERIRKLQKGYCPGSYGFMVLEQEKRWILHGVLVEMSDLAAEAAKKGVAGGKFGTPSRL